MAKTTSIPCHVLPLSKARFDYARILSTTVVLGGRMDRIEARLDRIEADLREFYRTLGQYEARLDNLEKGRL